MSPIERRILAAIRNGCAMGLRPTAIYLRAEDQSQLGRGEVDGLPVRPVTGKGPSRVYFEIGVALVLPKHVA